MITETFSNARNNLNAIMNRVVTENAPIRVKRQGSEAVILVSESEWSSIEETLYLLCSPANAKALTESVLQLDAGEGFDPEEFKE